MYYYTGSNLFGQWITSDKKVIDKFCSFTEDKDEQNDHNFNLQAATLINIGWSHNIFYYNKKFLVTGDYKYLGKRLELISLPNNCENNPNVTVVSNDYNLIVVNKDTCTFWVINLENKTEKKFNLMTEAPLESVPKRQKTEDHILKCVAKNESLVFLTSNRVYSGKIPNVIDTSQCIGEPIDVQCGNEHYMLLTATGRVYTWGNGRRLQLGNGEVDTLDVPTEVEALAGIKIIKISAGGWHSLALSEFGDLYAWGWNDTGQLGIKESSESERLKSYSIPTLVDFIDDNGVAVKINVRDMACGSKHSAVLLDDNSIWTSGNNKYGQLGLSITEYPSIHHFKKCCSFSNSQELMCGEWSTVVKVI